MKPHLLLCLLLFWLIGNRTNAQNKPKSSSLKPLPAKQTNIATGKEFIQTIPDKVYDNLKAGDIAPDVVRIDADEILEIKNGAIKIAKERQEALIDLKGNILVPFGKYYFRDDFPTFLNALFRVKASMMDIAYGYLNSKGEITIPFKKGMETFNSLNLTEFYSDITHSGQLTYIDNFGNVLPALPYAYHTGVNPQDINLDDVGKPTVLLPVVYKPEQKAGNYHNKIGFVRRNGKTAFPGQFIDAGVFCNDMCAVADLDNFGVVRWGFIDTTGRLVIPYKFRIKPGNFHEGLALVAPVDNADFQFAYIDKQGNIQIKIGTGPGTSKYDPGRIDQTAFFMRGYSFWRTYNADLILLDKRGEFHPLSEVVHISGIKPSDKLFISKYSTKGIYYDFRTPYTKLANGLGMVDYNGYEIFPAVFNFLQLDNFSSYAVAKMNLPPSATSNRPQQIQGIVNKQGVFVLIIEKKATF